MLLHAGITTLDTADIYGQSEAIIGQFCRLYPDAAQSLQVLTKISFMGGAGAPQTLSKDLLEYRIRGALTRLGISKIHLLQLHWDNFRSDGYLEVAKQLADLQSKGLIQHIGVTNFDVPHLIHLHDIGLKPVSNQVQYSVIDRRPQLYLSDYCSTHGIQLLPYSVLAGGFLADRYVGMPAAKARLNTISKAKAGTMLRELGGWTWLQDMLQVCADISCLSTTVEEWNANLLCRHPLFVHYCAGMGVNVFILQWCLHAHGLSFVTCTQVAMHNIHKQLPIGMGRSKQRLGIGPVINCMSGTYQHNSYAT